MTNKNADAVHQAVRAGYASIARGFGSCCGAGSPCCSAPADSNHRTIGYTDADRKTAPEGAYLGLGCGNPVAPAALQPGETVLDLGSGAGFDCFLAARKVGPKGRVIGVDMTPEMVERARENARRTHVANVEFRLGEIEHLPVPDSSIDVVISNCVINLSPDKPQVFREAWRVLKPGGRLLVSDIVLAVPLPPALLSSPTAYLGCIAGASLRADYLAMIAAAGFTAVQVVGEDRFPVELYANDPAIRRLVSESGLAPDELCRAASSVTSIKVAATR